MRSAPDDPKNGSSLEDLFSDQVRRQAAVPFTSSILSRRKTSWMSRKVKVKPKPPGQAGEPTEPVSNTVLRAVIAHAVLASLLASAQATIFECRRVSIPRTQSARRSVRLSICR
ncbi:hypothetical protein DFQ30_005560, partial [Apophysomyces sp. BC1015]